MNQQLEHAVDVLRDGGVIAYPTDTVYGLGCDVFNRSAVERVYRIKKRSLGQPFSVLLADEAQLALVSDAIPEVAWRLVHRFLPGGVTLVVPRAASFPSWVASGGDTVAVRIPDHPLALALIRSLGSPLVGTSANLSGFPNTISAEEVRSQLGDEVDFILDGGRCPGGIESTVVDVTGQIPVILREGAVSRGDIERACSENL